MARSQVKLKKKADKQRERAITTGSLNPDSLAAAGGLCWGRYARRLMIPSLIGILFYVLFVPSYFSNPFPLLDDNDNSVFYSVWAEMAEGGRLYVDVYDHKDPLFHYLFATAHRLMGWRGGMFLETVLCMASISLMACLLSRLCLRTLELSALILIFVIINFNPIVFFEIHAYQPAIFFYLFGVCMVCMHKNRWAAFLITLSAFVRIPMLLYAPAAFILALPMETWKEPRRFIPILRDFIIGGTAAVGAVFAGLLLRGELVAYIRDVLLFNILDYRDLWEAGHVGTLPAGYQWAHAMSWFGPVLLCAAAIALLYHLLFIVEYGRAMLGSAAKVDKQGQEEMDVRGHRPQLAPSATGGSVSVFSWALFSTLIASGTIWSFREAFLFRHYAQQASLGFTFLFAGTVAILSQAPFGRPFVRRSALLLSLAIMLFFSGYPQQFNRVTWRSSSGLAPVKVVSSDAREFSGYLQARYADRTVSYMVLQQYPSILTLLAPEEFVLSCRFIYLNAAFRNSMFEEYLECLADPRNEVVLFQQIDGPLPRWFVTQVGPLLAQHYQRVEKFGKYELWERQ